MESTQLSVQYGSSINASGVPHRFSDELYSHIARPHPYRFETLVMVVIKSWYSGHEAFA
jgi:hypothetical protein